MGDERVKLASSSDKTQMQAFVRNLLRDVQAVEYMIENNWFETGVKRIGAEQEMCLIDKNMKPAMKNMDILKDFHPEWITTELAQFNLETNLSPQEFNGKALSNMEQELQTALKQTQIAASKHGADILLTGIMPSLRKFDLSMEKLTPIERYKALMIALKELRGSDYDLRLSGIDELIIKHDSPLLEACNTSFQVHLQVEPKSFVPLYNIAQAISGPSMAVAVNSPLLFGKRLWHETRIALFQQSIDSRSSNLHMRDRQPRVTFGSDWLHNSILEIYREDIVRFRVLLSSEEEENAFEKIKNGHVPKLKALQVHNGTVYRWNRPCYGISSNGKPHLRIENRVLPSGPTVLDEMSNTALWLGLMEGMHDRYPDIKQHMSFDDARDNFFKAARTGIDSKFTWLNNKKMSAKDLMLEELIPIARHGLELNNVDSADIDRYLGTIEERTKAHMTGARWLLRTYTKFAKQTTKDEAITAMTSIMLKNQASDLPVHLWEDPELEMLKNYVPSHLLVEEFMDTDLFTVQRSDVLELVADMMDWRRIRYTPVEDSSHKLVGLITSRLLLRHFTRRATIKDIKAKVVEDLMIKEPITVRSGSSILEAIKIMEEHKIGCLPVINESQELVGIVTEKNYVQIARRFLKRQVNE